jgi:hypothetical protein
MRLVNVHLLYAVKAPWGSQYSEMLQPRPGYDIVWDGPWLRIMRDGKCVQVIAQSMVRSAEVVQEPEPVIELHVTNPEHLKVIEEHAPVQPQKRRGRPPKMR